MTARSAGVPAPHDGLTAGDQPTVPACGVFPAGAVSALSGPHRAVPPADRCSRDTGQHASVSPPPGHQVHGRRGERDRDEGRRPVEAAERRTVVVAALSALVRCRVCGGPKEDGAPWCWSFRMWPAP